MLICPNKSRDKLHSFQYLDLPTLAPPNRTVSHNLAITKSSDDKLELKEINKTKQASNWLQWLQYFTIYAVTLTEKYPNRGPELMIYMQDIANLAKGFAWHLVYNYDKNFRLAVQGNPSKNWAELDTVLLSTHVLAKFQYTNVLETSMRLVTDPSKVSTPKKGYKNLLCIQ